MFYIADGEAFIEFMKKHKKGEDFWKNNKKYLETHKLNIDELNKLYRDGSNACSKCPNKNGICNCVLGQPFIS